MPQILSCVYLVVLWEKLHWMLYVLWSYYCGICVPFDTKISLRHCTGEICAGNTFCIFIILFPIIWKIHLLCCEQNSQILGSDTTSCSFVKITDVVDRVSIFGCSLVRFLANPRLFDPTHGAFVKVFLYLISKTSFFSPAITLPARKTVTRM